MRPRGARASPDDDLMGSPPPRGSIGSNPFNLVASASRPYPQAHQAVPPPLRFPSTLGAFNLASSNTPPASPQRSPEQQLLETSYPLHGSNKLRRPSMLSMAQTRPTSFGSTGSADESPVIDPSSSKLPFVTTPQPRWATHLSPSPSIRRVSSAPPPIDTLSTSTPPPQIDTSGSSSPVGMEMDSASGAEGSRWKGKGKMRELPTLGARPLPAPLLATLISESNPKDHEIQSEARLQRLLLSHPSALPLTPRAPRSVRGRFPETVDDDDEVWSRRRSSRSRWQNSDSSEDDEDEIMATTPQAALDAPSSRPISSNGAVRSRPGASLGGLGFSGLGVHTPLGSPVVEKLEMYGSPSALQIGSPGMQWRESPMTNSVRPGKRKAQDDRFDPYKRPRGSSPALSPSKTSAIPIPASPRQGFQPFSALSTSNPQIHPYQRPIARSRAASPALSVSGPGTGRSGSGMGLAGGWTTQAATTPAPALGGLGLLSLGVNAAFASRQEREDSSGSAPMLED